MVHRGWSVPSGTQRKKRQKLCEGEVLPLDKSLLMGDFSVVRFRSDFVLFSEQNHMKALKNQWLWTRAMSFQTPCWSYTQRTHYRPWGADGLDHGVGHISHPGLYPTAAL